MFSGYSPLFTAGLLSAAHCQPSCSESSLGPRRGSLPDTRSPTTPQDEAAAFYFTMQPKRDEHEFRSFLSLDLAESQSLRSASLKRKASSKASRGWTITRIPEGPVPSPTLRLSKDSLRSIPSPKPAPSMNLPEVPKPPVTRLSSSAPAKKTFLSSLRISRSKPSKSPSLAPLRTSIATTSTVSTTVKRANRSDALARLEGRRRTSLATRKDFMSLSDDEDSSDDESDDADIDSIAPKSDSFDLTDDLFYAAFFEPEDLVLPSTSASLPSSPITEESFSHSSPSKPTVRRRPTLASRRSTKDWLPPLTSFMDMKSDDEHHQPPVASGWTWRSFIDVGGMA